MLRTLGITCLTLGFLLRLGFACSPLVRGYDGTHRYEPIARNLVAGTAFSRSLAPPYVADDFEVPGYPLFLAAIYRLFGESDSAVALTQLAVETLAVFFVWRLAREVGLSPTTAGVGAVLWWLSPWLPSMALAVGTESVAVMLTALSCFLFARGGRTGSHLDWVLAGFATGTGILVRPDAYVLGAVLPLAVLVWSPNTRVSARRKVLLAFWYGMALLVVLAPWIARTYRTHGRLELPGWQQFTQDETPWRRWTRFWIDDFETLRYFWGAGISPNYPREFPPSKISDPAELKEANRALFLARAKGTWGPDSDVIISNLASVHEARWTIRDRLIVPLRRVRSALLRVPTYTNWPAELRRPLQAATYSYWFVILAFAFLGGFHALRTGQSTLVFLFFLILCRLLMPFYSALGLEPRYQYQAFPAIYVFAGVGMAWSSSRVWAYRRYLI